jgi:hypothetical protein
VWGAVPAAGKERTLVDGPCTGPGPSSAAPPPSLGTEVLARPVVFASFVGASLAYLAFGPPNAQTSGRVVSSWTRSVRLDAVCGMEWDSVAGALAGRTRTLSLFNPGPPARGQLHPDSQLALPSLRFGCGDQVRDPALHGACCDDEKT